MEKMEKKIYKNSFGTALEQLLVISGTKNTMLAQELNYDASYISKWVSGKTVPSKKNIEMVIETISNLITEYIEEDRLEQMFVKLNVDTKLALRIEITEMLRNAYYDSIGELNEIPYINNATVKIMPRGQFSLLADFAEQLKGISNLKIAVLGDLFSLDRVSKLCMAGIKNHYFSMVDMHEDIQLDYILDVSKLQELSVYDTILLIHMMTSFSRTNFNLYHSAIASGKLLIAAEEHFSGVSLLGANEQMIVTTCSRDKVIANELYNNIQTYLDSNNKIFFNTDMKELIFNHRYLQTVLAQDCRWLVGHLTEHFLSVELFEQLLVNTFPQECHEELRLTHNLSKSRIKSDNIRIIFYNLSIMDFVLSGEIDFFNQKIILTPEQREKELRYLRDLFSEMKDGNLKLVKEGFVDDFKYITNPCFFLSESMQYLRLENKCYKNNILVVKNETVQSAFEHLFEVLWQDRPRMVIEGSENIRNKMNNFIEASVLISNN